MTSTNQAIRRRALDDLSEALDNKQMLDIVSLTAYLSHLRCFFLYELNMGNSNGRLNTMALGVLQVWTRMIRVTRPLLKGKLQGDISRLMKVFDPPNLATSVECIEQAANCIQETIDDHNVCNALARTEYLMSMFNVLVSSFRNGLGGDQTQSSVVLTAINLSHLATLSLRVLMKLLCYASVELNFRTAIAYCLDCARCTGASEQVWRHLVECTNQLTKLSVYMGAADAFDDLMQLRRVISSRVLSQTITKDKIENLIRFFRDSQVLKTYQHDEAQSKVVDRERDALESVCVVLIRTETRKTALVRRTNALDYIDQLLRLLAVASGSQRTCQMLSDLCSGCPDRNEIELLLTTRICMLLPRIRITLNESLLKRLGSNHWMSTKISEFIKFQTHCANPMLSEELISSWKNTLVLTDLPKEVQEILRISATLLASDVETEPVDAFNALFEFSPISPTNVSICGAIVGVTLLSICLDWNGHGVDISGLMGWTHIPDGNDFIYRWEACNSTLHQFMNKRLITCSDYSTENLAFLNGCIVTVFAFVERFDFVFLRHVCRSWLDMSDQVLMNNLSKMEPEMLKAILQYQRESLVIAQRINQSFTLDRPILVQGLISLLRAGARATELPEIADPTKFGNFGSWKDLTVCVNVQSLLILEYLEVLDLNGEPDIMSTYDSQLVEVLNECIQIKCGLHISLIYTLFAQIYRKHVSVPSMLTAASTFREDELVCRRLVDMAAEGLSDMGLDLVPDCIQACRDMQNVPIISYQLRLSITRILIHLTRMRQDMDKRLRTDYIIENSILSSWQSLRTCFPIGQLHDIQFDRLLLHDARFRFLLTEDVFFKRDCAEIIKCVGLKDWPRYVPTAMILAVKYAFPNMHKILSKPGGSLQLSREMLDRTKWKCREMFTNEAQQLCMERLVCLTCDDLKLSLPKQTDDQLRALMETVCTYYFGVFNPDQVLLEIRGIDISCRMTKLLALLILGIPLNQSIFDEPQNDIFLSEAIHMFRGDKYCNRLVDPPDSRDLSVSFTLPGKGSDHTFRIEKTRGWYHKDTWTANLRSLALATLLSPRGLGIWIGADATARLLHALDKRIRGNDVAKLKFNIMDRLRAEMHESDDLYTFLDKFIAVICGERSIWNIISNFNRSALYFICPLLLNKNLYVAMEVLQFAATHFQDPLITEFTIFLTTNMQPLTLSSTEYARSALASEMPLSALQLIARTSAVDSILLFDIFHRLNFSDGCRAACVQMDLSNGYERTLLFRERDDKQKLSQWTGSETLEAKKKSFVLSFKHLLMRLDGNECCEFFGKLNHSSSRIDSIENFSHGLIHEQMIAPIGDCFDEEVFKMRILDAWSSVRGGTQHPAFLRVLGLASKFPTKIARILSELKGDATGRLSSFLRIFDFYQHGEQKIAFSYLKLLLESKDVDDLQISFLKTLVEWADKGNFESWHSTIEVIKKHANLLGSLTSNSQLDTMTSLQEVHDILANFMYKRYTESLNYVESSAFKDKMQRVVSSESDLTQIEGGSYCKLLGAYTKMDRADVESTLQEYGELRLETLRCLIRHLSLSWTNRNAMVHTTLQLVHVMFHADGAFGNENINCAIMPDLLNLPSAVFVPVARQLTAKISETTQYLNCLISQMLEDHPFIITPLLLCLEKNEGRQDIIRGILEADRKNIEAINQYRRLFSFYETVASLDQTENAIPAKCLADLGTIDCIPLCTSTHGFVGDLKFYPRFKQLEGLTHPKVISCRDVDGQKVRQILKAGNDLRQDALIQQTFKTINSLLRRLNDGLAPVECSESIGAGFSIRCYEVCPVTTTCGVLSYCEDTVCLSTYLADPRRGAHAVFGGASEHSCKTCRNMLQQCIDKSKADKLKVYLSICDHFKPVMRYFFFDRFPEPWLWVHHVRQYTRSVACSSIAGYMLGLGDRHLSNMLLDQSNGEIIHIDFGIAFEQGKVLPIPEVVPFRLTRDIVDGFGPVGVNGLFRSTAVECLLALVRNKALLMSIVNVLVDDPLCDWTVDINKRYKHQLTLGSHQLRGLHKEKATTYRRCTGNKNKLAERAVTSIRMKLSIASTPNAVASRLNELIIEATKQENLCRMYHGWQPYL